VVNEVLNEAVRQRQTSEGLTPAARGGSGRRRGLAAMALVVTIMAPLAALSPPAGAMFEFPALPDEDSGDDLFDGGDLEVETEGDPAPGFGLGDGFVEESGDRGPLFAVPAGCPPAELATVVFEGEAIEVDDRAAWFEVRQVRAGESEPFTTDGLLEIRYGLDVQYIEVGDSYLVGAQLEPLLGLLYSQISEPSPLFGGDEIVGLAEIDLDCPEFADPVRTLGTDGAVVPTSVVKPLVESRGQLLAALVLPFVVVFSVLFTLAAFGTALKGVLRGLRGPSGR
jgi:hypothetical protein